ncbi:ATP12 family chaperone protein [Henriciella litoralis]|uniref:ATP12 family chaperone protein n=1 Tax=Henriciella litoralis TaxID=568102 RepID=UPI0009FD9127|nr:ATP12 family protein [Henriciella litoralis]
MTQQSQKQSQLPRRFYKTASACAHEGNWRVELDGRPVKTPAKNELSFASQDLAALVASEWSAQGEHIDPSTMPLTRLLNVAIDRAPLTRDAMADEIAKYAETDLVCHLAEGPTELRERQDAGWRPWRDWAGRELDIVLVPVEGIIASPQPAASLTAARAHAASLDDISLTGLTWGCALFGSAVLACAVERGALKADEAFELSRIDEAWQVEQWGEDEEAMDALSRRRKDAQSIGKLFAALSR